MTIQPDDDFVQMGEEFLEHFGKMGMRWGHRNSDDGSNETRTEVHIHERSRHGGLVALAVLAVAGSIALAAMPSSPVHIPSSNIKLPSKSIASFLSDGVGKTAIDSIIKYDMIT